jgi:hypothetical protein
MKYNLDVLADPTIYGSNFDYVIGVRCAAHNLLLLLLLLLLLRCGNSSNIARRTTSTLWAPSCTCAAHCATMASSSSCPLAAAARECGSRRVASSSQQCVWHDIICAGVCVIALGDQSSVLSRRVVAAGMAATRSLRCPRHWTTTTCECSPLCVCVIA